MFLICRADWFRIMGNEEDMKELSCDTTSSIDRIEAAVYEQLRPLGFRKYGRTLHRFVSGDLSQVIHFQCGQACREETHLMWVNIGIRVPECMDRVFQPAAPMKKYYHEYECNIRCRLGELDGGRETTYDLRGNITQIIQDISQEITGKVIPVLECLSSREAILAHRKEFPNYDRLNRHLILLEEALIYGHIGDYPLAKERFAAYYVQCSQPPIRPAHLKYLDELAKKLEFR